MPRYFVSSYTFVVPLAHGKLALRVSCPTCGSVHAGIARGGQSLCIGCGQTLAVRGGELFVCVVPEGTALDEDRHGADKPDHPTFWYDNEG